MRVIIVVMFVAVAAAQVDQQQAEDQPQQFHKVAETVPQQQFYYAQPNQYAAYTNMQNRNGVGARHGFFDIAGTYASGLVTTFLFVVGTILLLDLMFGDINIVETILGRSGKSLWDKGSEMMTGLDAVNLIDSASEVYTALEKYKNMNLPRSF